MPLPNWLKSIQYWYRPRALLRAILSLDDSAHSIAKGTAIGMFIGFTPTVGIQMILVLLVSLFVGFNRKAALLTVYISNPITMVPMYWFNYRVGTIFFESSLSYEQFRHLLQVDNLRAVLAAVFVDIGMPLLFGSLIVSTILGAATYPAIRWLLRRVGRDTPLEAPAGSEPAASHPSDVAEEKATV